LSGIITNCQYSPETPANRPGYEFMYYLYSQVENNSEYMAKDKYEGFEKKF
jgi:hypothetical protein